MSARRLRILISYHYFKKVDLDEMLGVHFGEPRPEVFADSGAFSAMTQGAVITVAEYADWLKRWGHWFSTYANLDVIRHADLTWQNQQSLEQMGFNPLPVFHVLETWSWLERYLEQYPYIALGVAGSSYRNYMPWLIQCFQRAQGRAVYHGFGITAHVPLMNLPWYSVDSSSWGQGFRYGLIPMFDPVSGKWSKVQLGDYSSVYPLAALIRNLGFDPEDFADRSRNQRKKVAALAALTYMSLEDYLRGRHGLITIPQGLHPAATADPGVGARLYLADGAYGPSSNFVLTAQGLREQDQATAPASGFVRNGLKLFLADITPTAARPGGDLGHVQEVLRHLPDPA